ncbi:MAG: hypothetical protein CO030_03525, partial [Candidatus Magasanikbacteria bacterium CG_4_9_14_0_2_um_filter_42_11]
MSTPIISICIPTYKRASCLKQCLDSIVVQLDDPLVRDRVEIVISDNASPDNTENIVEEFKKKYNNIVYYKNTENIGVDRNILNVAARASGEYVWFMGDDDALFSGALVYMLDELRLHKFDYCLVNCLGYDNFLQKPAVRQPNFAITNNTYYETLDEAVKKMDRKSLVGNFCGLSIQVIRRSLWDGVTNKGVHVGTNAVHLYTTLLAMKGKPFAMIAKPLVKVRAANIRWDTFPGLDTLSNRSESTYIALLWILKTYDIPHSKEIMRIRQRIDLVKSWIINVLKRYLFKS